MDHLKEKSDSKLERLPIPEPYIKGMRNEDHLQPLDHEQWRDIETDPPQDGQCVRVKSIIERDAWYVPSNEFITWIGISNQDDEKAEPVEWHPIEGSKSYKESWD